MDDRHNEVLAVAILFLTLSLITVGLRVYVRTRLLKSFGLDDWLMLLTLTFFVAYIICQIGGVVHGTGRHHRDIPHDHLEKALRYWWLCELFYIQTACWLKVALGVFLLRVAIKPVHVWIIRILIIGTGMFGTGYFFVALLQCRPLSVFWTVNPGAPQCITPKVMVSFTYVASAINSTADWTFGILPIFIVWDLEMSRRQKILVAGILAFAAVGSTATIVRVPSIKGLGQTEDFLWTTTNIAIWSTVEPGIGISAGCMATLRPLMHTKLFKSCFGYVSTLRSNSHPSYPMKNQKRSTTPLSQQDVNRSATRLRSDLEQVGNTTTITSGEEQSKPNNTWRELGYSPGIYKDVMWTCTEADADQIEEPVPQASSSASTASSMPLHRYKGSHPDSHFA